MGLSSSLDAGRDYGAITLAVKVSGARDNVMRPEGEHVQIGVDIGGTFTDIVALDGEGRLALAKVPSTPKDLLDGIGAAVGKVLALAGAKPGDVERFIHGTTVATNAILEQKGAVTAVLTTAGFEDVLELGRMKRSRMYDLAMDPETPTFLAPRRRARAAGREGPRARPAPRGRRARVGAGAPRTRGLGHRGVLSVLVRQSRPRAAHAGDRRGAGAGDQRVALVGGGSDLPRIRASLRDGLRRLSRPRGEALSGRARRHVARPRRGRAAAHHAVARRHRVRGAGGAAAGDAVPLRSCGRRDRRPLRRRVLRRPRLRLPRHGRYQQRRGSGTRRGTAARR